jgi:hypothetical protein
MIPPFIGCGIPIPITPQNFSSIRPFKLRETSDECINFPICFLRENESDPNSSFFMNGILDILFEEFFPRVLCVVFKHVPTNFEVFFEAIFTVAPMSNRPDHIAPRLPTCANIDCAVAPSSR